MSTWKRIREARTDLTDYVTHLTRDVVEWDDARQRDDEDGMPRLMQILQSGYLLPTSGLQRTYKGERVHTVKGTHKAVCFSEQPLEQVPVTLQNCRKYQGYGIAFHKVNFYQYGGRHAIYGDDSLLASLTDDYKYLWVRYEPMKEGPGYPVDFTFEREWRSRVAPAEILPWGHDLPGVPLLLPEDFRRLSLPMSQGGWMYNKVSAPDFRILVASDVDVKELRDFIDKLQPSTEASVYYSVYYRAVKKAQIISLEQVERKLLDEHDTTYSRIETLPFPEDIVSPNPKRLTLQELIEQNMRRMQDGNC